MSQKAQTKLIPGTYRLLEDLPPLVNDKRKTRDWRCCPMKAGTLFFYQEWAYAPDEEKPSIRITEQRIYPVGCYQSESVAPNESSKTRQLEELLTREEETPSLWLRREHGSSVALGVLDELFSAGKVTMDDVELAADRYLETL